MSPDESIRAIFKDNLNKLFEEKCTTQKSLADFLGVSGTTISDWRKGKKMPRMDKIDRICSFFHVERGELLSTFDATDSNAVFAYAATRPSSFHKIPPSPVLHNTGYVRNGFRHDHNPQLHNDGEEHQPLNLIDSQLERYVAELVSAYKEEVRTMLASDRKAANITEAEQALLDAYRNAPADKKTIVNLTLGLTQTE